MNNYCKLGLMVIGYGLLLWCSGPAFRISGFGLKENFSLSVSAAGFALTIIGIFQKGALNIRLFGAAALGLLYISLSWALMISLRSRDLFYNAGMDNFYDKGWIIPLAIIVSIWVNDTMAYIVGSLIGKTPLSRISPKKTWEGTLGGILLSVAVIALLSTPLVNYAHGTVQKADFIWIAAIAAIVGTLGDLLESKLKRLAGVKDSGSLMPGHGGFLDRFDSLLLATPFVWLYITIVH
jgi:phosphatidate cytidylyltransferase